MKQTHGIALKKRYGQHFLQWQSIVDEMVHRVKLDDQASVLEIGGGAGILTRTILKTPAARLWVVEIDEEWATYLKKHIVNPQLTVILDNILDIDMTPFEAYQPWTLLANLPYQITFPILYRVQKYRHLFKEGVVMVQEEVAQKIVKKGGRGYGFSTLFLQHYFTWELMSKIPPHAFNPPPAVDSRLLYFKPIAEPITIPDEEKFWEFIKSCFSHPRRTLKNNLAQTYYPYQKVPESTLKLRAQQMNINDFLVVWELFRNV